MDIGSLNEGTSEVNEGSAPIYNEISLKKPFNSWRECRKNVFRNYGDILKLISNHVDVKLLTQIKHILILVIPSLLQPIEREESKLQLKYQNLYRLDNIKLRIKNLKISFVGIIKEIVKVRKTIVNIIERKFFRRSLQTGMNYIVN